MYKRKKKNIKQKIKIDFKYIKLQRNSIEKFNIIQSKF